ncbi:SDR family oxidoreductase [Actinomadura sp. NAK00032]|uniref:SDR family oxidoreductase n=1 Tax=Actinomadura sp. NAK00032 TaxID=2742128 RepID=UPI0015901021|nr:SDR family oxidoreductase [Actinomadura sp. NAK00032]QKW35785.1 SDR family oxidoreductase [Actinomadura sp. NAK00032]
MILVTGASGTLGRVVARRLAEAGADVHGLSRRERAAEPGMTWHKGDLWKGEGVAAAVAGAETIVHCASDPFHPKRDLPAARRLVEAARGEGAPHLVYISIVGVDKIPYGYYRTKHAVERLLEGSGLPYTILRATQFHTLPDAVFNVLTKIPGVAVVPRGLRDQPVDVAEVAGRLADLALAAGPARRVEDMGGPEVLTVEEMLGDYLAARGLRRPLTVPLPLPGKVGRGFREGHHLVPGHADGTRTWKQFLEEAHARN